MAIAGQERTDGVNVFSRAERIVKLFKKKKKKAWMDIMQYIALTRNYSILSCQWKFDE